MKKSILSFTILSVTALLGGISHAAVIADVEIILDWSSMEIVAEPTASLPSPFSQYKGLHSEGWVNGDPVNAGYAETGPQSVQVSDSDTGWNGASLTNSIGANITALTTANDLLVAHSTSSSNRAGDTSGWINGNLHRSIEFIPDVDATYTFSVDYEIEYFLSRDDPAFDNASIGALVHFMLYWHELATGVDDWHLLDEQRDEFSASLEDESLLSMFDDTGTVMVTASLTAGEIYSLGTHQHVSSFTRSLPIPGRPVPEPGTLLIFAAGIVGYVVFRLRRKT